MDIISIYVAIFGLLIGSFLTCCIFRIPLSRLHDWLEPEELEAQKEFVELHKNVTISNPARSFCVTCRKTLSWYENIPLISFIIQRGRCYCKKEKVSFRYPAVELLTMTAALGAYTYFGLTVTAALVFLWLSCLIVISFIDYDLYIIPDLFTFPGMIVGVLFGILQTFNPIATNPFVHNWQESLLGLCLGGGGLWFVSIMYRLIRKKDGLGLGDVKLIGAVGAWFGVYGVFYTIFIGSLLGTVGGILMLLCTKKGSEHPIPFGPYLAVATVLFIFNVSINMYG